MPLLLVVLLGYLAGLAREISQPPVAAQNQRLTSWLAARHLHTGLSGYWESNIVTLTSGNRVQIRLVKPSGGRLIAGAYETNAAWYDPGPEYGEFRRSVQRGTRVSRLQRGAGRAGDLRPARADLSRRSLHDPGLEP